MLDSSALAEELVSCLLDGGLRDSIVEVESSNWSVFSWSCGAWEREHDAFWDVIKLAIGLEADGLPFITSEDPVAHVVDGSISGRGSTGEFSELDDLSSSLLNSWGELIGSPAGINEGLCILSTNGAVSDIWVHSWRVVSPNGHLLDVSHGGSSLKCKLGKGSVMIESGHGSEVFSWKIWSVSLANQRISVGWVTNDNSLGITGTVVVDGFANIDKDLSVVLKKISTLHTWSTWLGSDQEVVVNILESCAEVASDHNIVEKWESAVVKLSLDSLENLFLEGQVKQVKDNSLVLAKEFSTTLSSIRFDCVKTYLAILKTIE